MRVDYLLSLTLLFFMLFLGGCAEEPSPPPTVKREGVPKNKVESLPAKKDMREEVKTKEKAPYSYYPAGKRDPFQPYIAPDVVAEDADAEPLTELEKYELSQFKLVAIVGLGAKKVAMVEDPVGTGHTLYIGTPIGTKRGKVVAIEEGAVSVEEKSRDMMGEVKIEIRKLVIETPEGGM